jgi:SAM-dependent methyltransferase
MATPDELHQPARTMALANVDQAAAWDGEEGDHWTQHADRYDAAARRYDPKLIAAAQISTHDDVLDIGCGCGPSTRAAARVAVSGTVLGVDLSARMIEEARRRSRAEGLTNTKFEQADAQVHPFDAHAFDVAISRFGAMFFADPVAAFRNIGRALRPGARLALLSWQQLGKNQWLLALREALAVGRTLPEPPLDAPGPFGLADADAVRRILAEAGFKGVELQEIREPVYLGADGEDAFSFLQATGMVRGLLEELDEPTRMQALEQLRTMLAAHETADGVLLDSCAWLTTAHRP